MSHDPRAWASYGASGTELCPLPALRRKGPSSPIWSVPIKGGEDPRLDQKQAAEEAARGNGSRDAPALKSEKDSLALGGTASSIYLRGLEGL